MLWRFVPGWRRTSIADRMIRTHSRWLTRAVRMRLQVPRIPTRRVSHGGFSSLMSTPTGREQAHDWWAEALDETSPPS